MGERGVGIYGSPCDGKIYVAREKRREHGRVIEGREKEKKREKREENERRNGRKRKEGEEIEKEELGRERIWERRKREREIFISILISKISLKFYQIQKIKFS